MAASQFFSLYKYPITLKPLTFPDYKETYNDIFNLQNSFRILIHQLDATFEKAVPEAPEDGKAYVRKDKTWVEESSGAGLSLSTISIADGLNTLAVGKVSALTYIVVTAPARVRLYCTAAGRTLDSSRPLGTKAAKSAGLVFEFNAVSSLLSADLNPVPVGHNGDSPATSVLYSNIEPVSGAVTATFNYVKLVS